MASVHGQSNCLNTIRLAAAFAVIFSHAFPIVGSGSEPIHYLTGGKTDTGLIAVYIFFILSGYLIAGSFERNSLRGYIKKRSARIFPGLVASVLFCALVLGPIYTTLPLSEYFTRVELFKFIGNAILLPVDYVLPGVFENHPSQKTNVSLWTLKYEFACYIIAPILLIGLLNKKLSTICLWILSFPLIYVIDYERNLLFNILYNFFYFYRFFGAGMIIFLYREKIPIIRYLPYAMSTVCLIGLFTPYPVEFLAVFAPYPLLVLGLTGPDWLARLTARGDISYGVYLYGYPVQQVMFTLRPETEIDWFINFFASCLLVVPLAIVSWILIEKPFLKRKTIQRHLQQSEALK